MAVIVLLAGAVVVLIAGVIFMQEEIRSLRSTVAELKPLQGNNVLHFTESATIVSICHRRALYALTVVVRILMPSLFSSFKSN